jgi:hypothetical protein
MLLKAVLMTACKLTVMELCMVTCECQCVRWRVSVIVYGDVWVSLCMVTCECVWWCVSVIVYGDVWVIVYGYLWVSCTVTCECHCVRWRVSVILYGDVWVSLCMVTCECHCVLDVWVSLCMVMCECVTVYLINSTSLMDHVTAFEPPKTPHVNFS